MCHDKYHTNKRIRRSGEKHEKAIPYKREKSSKKDYEEEEF